MPQDYGDPIDSSTAIPAHEHLERPRRPRLKRHLHAEVIGSEHVWLFSEGDHRVLESRLLAMLIPLIDGRNTAQDIADRLDGRARVADVLYGLWELEDAGYLSFTSDEAAADGPSVFADLLGIVPEESEPGARHRW